MLVRSSSMLRVANHLVQDRLLPVEERQSEQGECRSIIRSRASQSQDLDDDSSCALGRP